MDRLWTHSMKHYLQRKKCMKNIVLQQKAERVNARNLIMSKLCLRIIYLQELQETGLPVSLTKEHL